jgi:large subunit ribosomal protein L18
MALQRDQMRAMRRARVRHSVRGSDQRPRLSVYRSLHHIYAQVISDESGRTLVAAGTNGGELREAIRGKRGVEAAKTLGQVIARRCLDKGIDKVVFDRNGFLYHGKVKALADAAREGGLKF